MLALEHEDGAVTDVAGHDFVTGEKERNERAGVVGKGATLHIDERLQHPLRNVGHDIGPNLAAHHVLFVAEQKASNGGRDSARPVPGSRPRPSSVADDHDEAPPTLFDVERVLARNATCAMARPLETRFGQAVARGRHGI